MEIKYSYETISSFTDIVKSSKMCFVLAKDFAKPPRSNRGRMRNWQGSFHKNYEDPENTVEDLAFIVKQGFNGL